MVLAVLPVILAMQEPVLLTYKANAEEPTGMQRAFASTVSKPVPKTLKSARYYTFEFGGQRRMIALGRFGTTGAAVLDRDGDGSLVDESPIPMTQRGTLSGSRPFSMTWRIGDQVAKGQYRLQSYKMRDNRVEVMVGATGAWRGKVAIRDMVVPVRVADVRGNGDYSTPDALAIGLPGQSYMTTKGIGHDGIYRSVKASPTGESVVLEEVTIPSVVVPFSGNEARITAKVGEDPYYVVGHGGTISVPKDATIVEVEVSRKDSKERTWMIHAYDPEVYTGSKANAEVQSAFALEPIQVVANGRKQSGQWVFDLSMRGANGYSLAGIEVDGRTPEAPNLHLERNGKAFPVQKFHYG